MSDLFLALTEWVKSSPADDFWFWAITLVVAAVAGFFFAFSFIQRKRIIEDTPTSKIRSAAQGYLELVGHGELMDGQPVVSPLTRTPCTWYEYKVEERRQTGKRTEWKTIRKEISDALFLIRDETGHCIIDPEGAYVTVASKDVWYGNEVTPLRGPSGGTKNSLFFGSINRRYRYTEKRMHDNETLYAIGLFKTVGGAGAKLDINEDVRELIREWKTDTEALMKKFDLNKDGEIDLQEWQRVRDDAYKHVMAKHDEQKNLPPIHIMNKTNDKRRPFILSAIPQDDLTRRLHLYSVLSISIFVICGSFATWIISLRLAT